VADFFNEFWHWYVAVITVLSILGCGILLWSQSTYRVKLRADGTPEKTTGHVWDEDLTELNTPMPRWWIVLFWLTIAFGFAYLALYPGLGSYAGKLGWNSNGEYQAELKQAKHEFGPLFAKYANQDLKAVASKGFPNLADRDWLHGGEPSVIKQSIMHGRVGTMPPMGAALGSDKDIESVAAYVRDLSGLSADPIKVAFGKPKFAACVACHGAKGEGNPAMGAPNLADKVWLYGGSPDTVMETIRKGRTNTMPAFGEFLGEEKVHVLAAYVWSLSNAHAAQRIVTAEAK
jgi:cytochrome c oxidase cbb3-type subunit 3